MSTDLEIRLRSLGEHLDAERAAVADLADGAALTTVVPFAPRRSPRIWWAAAAAVVLVVGLVAVIATRDDATQPTDSVPPTPAPTTPTTVAPTETTVGQAEPPESQPGDLTFDVTYGPDDGSSDRQGVVDWIGARGQALGLGTRVTDENPSDPTLRIVVSDVRSEDAAAVQRAILHLGDDVVVRPVTGGCGVVSDLPLTTPEPDPRVEQRLPWPSGTPGSWCTVGPAAFNREVFTESTYTESTDPSVPGMLTANLSPGAGEAAWNALASACYDRDSTCPTGQLAIEWGGILMNVATVQATQFSGTVALGTFGTTDGLALADQINQGPANFRLAAVAP
ncbi:MAG: hypothetical protein ACOYMR_15985 [Ilumatobacteraceae bacterium]